MSASSSSTRSPAAKPRSTVLTETGTFIARKWLKIRNNPMYLWDVLSRPLLFLLIFTALFSKAVAGGVGSYQNTIAPGMMVFAALSAASIVASELSADVKGGIFERIRTLPVSRIAPLAGGLVADIPQYLIDGLAIMLVGLLLGWRPAGGVAGICLALVLLIVFTWAVSWACVATSLSDGVASRISSMLLLVLTFLSNAFVPVDLLPDPVRVVTQINPVTHAIGAIASLANGGSLMNVEVLICLGVSAVLIAVCAPLAVHSFNRAMR